MWATIYRTIGRSFIDLKNTTSRHETGIGEKLKHTNKVSGICSLTTCLTFFSVNLTSSLHLVFVFGNIIRDPTT